MKLTRCKKIFLIIALTAFVVLLFTSNTVSAAINTEYSTNDTVPDTELGTAFEDSTLLNLLAKLIYAVGRFLEWILGTIFKMLTGSSDFPWADKIVFNSVPLLDVNFINPDGSSFVGQTAIKSVLKDTYATILTLAASFFGIVVLITAIKLVITTIASDKAKYKKAIVDWLIGFVMLFCIHYAISFIFYLNEQLVLVASRMVKDQIGKHNIVALVQADELANELIEDVRSRGIKYNGTPVADILEENTNILTTWMNALASKETSKGLQEGLMKGMPWWTFGTDVKDNKDEQYETLGMIISWAAAENVSVKELQNIKQNIKVYYYEITQNVYENTNNHYSSEQCAQLYAPETDREAYDACVEGKATESVSSGRHQALAVTYVKQMFAGDNFSYKYFLDKLETSTSYSGIMGISGDDKVVRGKENVKNNSTNQRFTKNW